VLLTLQSPNVESYPQAGMLTHSNFNKSAITVSLLTIKMWYILTTFLGTQVSVSPNITILVHVMIPRWAPIFMPTSPFCEDDLYFNSHRMYGEFYVIYNVNPCYAFVSEVSGLEDRGSFPRIFGMFPFTVLT
jgi:hypothetical protein